MSWVLHHGRLGEEKERWCQLVLLVGEGEACKEMSLTKYGLAAHD